MSEARPVLLKAKKDTGY